MADVQCDVLVIGASLGGVAAALRAGAIGATVSLVEPSGWLGGQMTGQGVCTPDENQYVTNGAYRVHPSEWAVGEAAGALAGFCSGSGVTTAAVLADAGLLRSYQKLLLGAGVLLFWWSDAPYGHPAFEATQLLGVAQVFHGNGRDLSFDVDQVLTASDAQALLARAGLTISFPQPNMTRGAAAVWLAGQLSM